ncbi:unnamed protein product [Durusdinium trenchii]|uniref:Cyclomaltodextrin glucanotransferase (Cyclodextrin-glycosyltransferase) (CGTase) n=2 Tax=Durusdinium trenchii TaxID=1381693 RepID=A0ABP0HJZ4_9DINO
MLCTVTVPTQIPTSINCFAMADVLCVKGPGLGNWAETPEEVELEQIFQKKGKMGMSKDERKSYYGAKFARAAAIRLVAMYERAWDECIRRELAASEAAQALSLAASASATSTMSPRSLSTTPQSAKSSTWGGDLYELKVHFETSFGQELYLVGSVDELGLWDCRRAVHMAWTAGNVWTAKVSIPADRNVVEYKYLIGQHGQFQWEGGCNHRFETTGGRCLSDHFNH